MSHPVEISLTKVVEERPVSEQVLSSATLWKAAVVFGLPASLWVAVFPEHQANVLATLFLIGVSWALLCVTNMLASVVEAVFVPLLGAAVNTMAVSWLKQYKIQNEKYSEIRISVVYANEELEVQLGRLRELEEALARLQIDIVAMKRSDEVDAPSSLRPEPRGVPPDAADEP